eukprot:Rhum_TRINITY_DN17788_c0_g1::Rhum_TRINITY_DN17788_c0_g1_i1::g.166505::m.166505
MNVQHAHAPPPGQGRTMLAAPQQAFSSQPIDQGASATSAQSGYSDGGWHSISTDSNSSDLPQTQALWPNYPPPLPAAFPAGNAMTGSPRPPPPQQQQQQPQQQQQQAAQYAAFQQQQQQQPPQLPATPS